MPRRTATGGRESTRSLFEQNEESLDLALVLDSLPEDLKAALQRGDLPEYEAESLALPHLPGLRGPLPPLLAFVLPLMSPLRLPEVRPSKRRVRSLDLDRRRQRTARAGRAGLRCPSRASLSRRADPRASRQGASSPCRDRTGSFRQEGFQAPSLTFARRGSRRSVRVPSHL
jgi:hypothetical protein